MTAVIEARIASSKTAVTITRPGSGEPTFDEVTGDLVPPAATTVYDGPALLNFISTRSERERLRGDESESESRYQVSVPLLAGPFRLGDEVTVRECADPQMVDGTLWVDQIPGGSAVSRRRLLCSTIHVGPRA
jgi:hypothetical protein